ncbi:endonuclease-reverse transcriptase [Elysia marginata]|uniref:Endonuclease-reverse transcriptase n=1 Tax=Elysia marginata TaxID=1093978 RepID=A0AAV4JW82_9GAST|nr:endonuclease-reverse transcriptase [Elysia marginata]
MSKNKAPGPDEVPSDVFFLGGEAITTYLTILQTKDMLPSWNEAKIIILFKKGDQGDIKIYRLISLLAHSYKLFTRLLQKRVETVLDKNQPYDQAGFRKEFSTTDHIYSLNQVIEKTNEYNLPLCVGFINYEKAFNAVDHFAIIKALRKININETYVQMWDDIYRHPTVRMHINNLASKGFHIKRRVRQGDPISPKFFLQPSKIYLKKANLNDGIKIDAETLTNLRFADDVALMSDDTTQMEEELNTLNTISKEVGLKMHKGKNQIHDELRDHKQSLNRKRINRTSTKLQEPRPNNFPQGHQPRRSCPPNQSRMELFRGKTEKFSWTTKYSSR